MTKIVSMVVGLCAAVAAADEAVTVFRSSDAGYVSIRIPALITATNGDVLAFAEGRAVNTDQGQNDILLRRSTDSGRTWLPIQKLADFGKASLNNPCPVLDARTGRIILFFQQYPVSGREFGKMDDGCTSSNTVHNWMMWSDNAGASWSPPTNITVQVKRPKGVTTLASGPGNGIQLQRGPHVGRLLIPFNEGPAGRWRVYAAFSDDGGKTWRYGEAAPGSLITNKSGKVESQVNEVQMAELADGSVLLNSRSQTGARFRRQSISRDGGETWSPVELAKDLHDDPCMASIIAVDDGRVQYFSGPTKRGRFDGVLFTSRDGGKSWQEVRAIRPGRFAYSSLAELREGALGCLYETGEKAGYERIDFVRIAR